MVLSRNKINSLFSGNRLKHKINVPLLSCDINVSFNDSNRLVLLQSFVKAEQKTGVEMEALTAVSVAALTVYDMTKALGHDAVIQDIRLVHKDGGKSDYKL